MDITITVRDGDVSTLNELAERDWRSPSQQASAMLEQALNSARARSNPSERTRRAPRRMVSHSNGVARVEA